MAGVAGLVLIGAEAVASSLAPVRVNVEAGINGASNGLGAGLATGLVFGAGDRLFIDASGETWGLCGLSGCVTDAAGNFLAPGGPRPSPFPATATYFGETFTSGTLVGRLGSGDFFGVGNLLDIVVSGTGGELVLWHWDIGLPGSGGIQVEIDPTDASSVVPLPPAAVLLLGGLAGLALSRRGQGLSAKA